MEKIAVFIEQIVEYMGAFGFLGGFLFVFLESFIPPVPVGVIVGLNMLSLGKVFGFLISYLAVITGSTCSFFLFRYLFKDKFIGWFSRKNQIKIERWMNKLSNIDFNTLVVLLAIPVTPAFLVNIAAGLSDISFRKYLIAMLIGKPAMLIFYGYIAVSFVESLSDPVKILYIFFLVIGAYIISKIIEKIVKVEK